VRHIDDETIIAVVSHLMESQISSPSGRRVTSTERVVEATVACVARVGVAKTTLDDVAREAGCARATVYRSFPGKQPLLRAVVAREADLVTGQVRAAASGAETLSDAAVAVITTGARALLDHGALRFVLTVEPELLLPHISFDRGNALLSEVAVRIGPAFVGFLEPEQALRFTEWLARIAFSYLCSPQAAELLDETRVRALVEDFVLPGLEGPVPIEGIMPL
jgi:AcrR family transcriptional regulator